MLLKEYFELPEVEVVVVVLVVDVVLVWLPLVDVSVF